MAGLLMTIQPGKIVGGAINVNSLTGLPVVGDGITQNYNAWDAMKQKLYALSPEAPVTVTLTVGSPCVVNWTGHGLKPNQAFYFTVSSGGALPTGISPHTPYFVTLANMTANSFTFTAFNNYNKFGGMSEGAPINTTGSVSGTVSVVITGRQWINLYIPPGNYVTGTGGAIQLVANGLSRVRIFAYGCVFDTTLIGSATGWPWTVPTTSGWLTQWFDLLATTPNEINSQTTPTVTLQSVTNIGYYYVGQWVAIIGLDLQNQLGNVISGPPNPQFFEYNQITAINTSTGVLTLRDPLKNVYMSSFPNLANPPATGPKGSSPVGGGPAMVLPMGPMWDCEVEVYGATWPAPTMEPTARKQKFIDCTFGTASGGCSPTVTREFVFRNCFFGVRPGTDAIEIDKIMDYLEIDGCEANWQVASSSVNRCLIKNAHGSVYGTPKRLEVRDSTLVNLQIGTQVLGTSDTVVVSNTWANYFDRTQRNDDAVYPPSGTGPSFYGNNILATWAFSNGTFSKDLSAIPASGTPQGWAVPGGKFFFNDETGIYDNMGCPFVILNAYMSGAVFSFDTTLRALPTLQTQNASTTLLTLGSPGVVNWTSHGLAANTPVVFLKTNANTLPTGLTAFTVYFVKSPATNTFNVSATSGGTAINFTGTQSGTQTVVANPLHIRPHPCPRFTGIGNTGTTSLVDLNGAVDEPIFSRMRRSFAGGQSASTGYYNPAGRLWGKLVSLTVNVIQVGTSGTLNIACPGFTQPNLALSPFSQTIDLTTAGIRTVTPTAHTSLGTDVLTNYGDWLSAGYVPLAGATNSQMTFNFAGTPPAYQNNAIVVVDILTDQGITKYPVLFGSNSQVGVGAPQILIDASIQSYQPS